MRAGARLAARLAAGVSRMTLIQMIRAMPDPPVTAPRVRGVDEFALHKDHRYGPLAESAVGGRPGRRAGRYSVPAGLLLRDSAGGQNWAVHWMVNGLSG